MNDTTSSEKKQLIEDTKEKIKQVIKENGGFHILSEPISLDALGDDLVEQTRNILSCFPLPPEALERVYRENLMARGFQEHEIPSFFVQ